MKKKKKQQKNEFKKRIDTSVDEHTTSYMKWEWIISHRHNEIRHIINMKIRIEIFIKNVRINICPKLLQFRGRVKRNADHHNKTLYSYKY